MVTGVSLVTPISVTSNRHHHLVTITLMMIEKTQKILFRIRRETDADAFITVFWLAESCRRAQLPAGAKACASQRSRERTAPLYVPAQHSPTHAQ